MGGFDGRPAWPEERLAQPRQEAAASRGDAVEALVKQGRSYTEIAAALGLKYFQVASAANKRGLKANRRGQARSAEVVASIQRRPPVGEPGTPFEVLTGKIFAEGYLGQTGRVSLAELKAGLCRFPIDQPDGAIRYCGGGAESGQPYCPHHGARSAASAEPHS